jgi:hypothetical protein
MTMGGDFSTVMHILMTRSYAENGRVQTSIDVYKNIDPSTALVIALAFVSKARRRDLPEEYLQGSVFLRGTARAATSQEIQYFCT